ncbi:Pyridine nucleotide-disulfide oxidoreductase [Trachipleistophora hominis]|uniref:Pyridine nucleotide-disulfide oxidoreductase n=1 Tax=Trachipleistophora hominis TaxID=72359 RepID=L7JY11_TRAHO|nr:Pyridine nucleotide-disulfide oxidoreductase [Trachipleistophora hominis]
MYDLIVIGGGSGGMAAAREAAKFNKRVLLVEKGELGGTCVNLGCVPKKITYNMTSIVEQMQLASSYGMQARYELNYELFKRCRDDVIRRLNAIYEKLLGNSNVEIIRGYARVISAGEVEVNGQVYKGTYILLASGSKPKALKIKGAEFVRYSDDFFYLTSIPKKTVIIGSGYISLEIAFMLALLGSDVSIVLRGKHFLSHFDTLFDAVVKEQLKKYRIETYYEENVLEVREESNDETNEGMMNGEDMVGNEGMMSNNETKEGMMSEEESENNEKKNRSNCKNSKSANEQISAEQKENDVPLDTSYGSKIKHMKVIDVSKEEIGRKVRFDIRGQKIDIEHKEDVYEIHKDELRVELEGQRTSKGVYEVVLKNTTIKNVNFVMCAIGRDCDLSYVQLPVHTYNNYAVVDHKFMTSVPNVYAVGDLVGPDHMLTPFAIFCSRKLVRFLFNDEPMPADVYEFVPSVIFTHPPCASVGLSEAAASAKYDSVEVYETRFNNLLYALSEHKTASVFKAIVHRGQVVGLHLFGNGVDEMVQGFALSMKNGLSLSDLNNCVCVHPTAAEEVVTLCRVTPRAADKRDH